MPVKVRQLVGLYSGEAADGIDAAVVEVRGRGEQMKVRQIAARHYPYEAQLHRRIVAATGGGEKQSHPLHLTAELDRDVGTALGAAASDMIARNGRGDVTIEAIGSSGQQIVRCGGGTDGGGGVELSAGCPAIIAGETGLAVVSGFAAGDLAAGGASPAVCAWPNWLLFHDRRLCRVVIQLGAIAKLTFIGAGAPAREVVSFDVGPGTILIDALSRKFHGRAFDADGAIAAHGSINRALVNELLAGGYFQRPSPKAALPAEWGPAAVWRVISMGEAHRCSGADLLATVTEMTAQSVAGAVSGLTERPHEIILCGGGALNIHLAGRIRKLLSPSSTYTVERYDISLRAHGAVCMVLLAAARLSDFSAHCPSASGAPRQAVLGSVTRR